MKSVRRVFAVLSVLVAAFLVYAIVAAVTSQAGARVGVCVGYAVASGLLCFLAAKLWNWRGGGTPQSA